MTRRGPAAVIAFAICLVSLGSTSTAGAAPEAIRLLQRPAHVVDRYEQLELQFELPSLPQPANPFDPKQIDVRTIFTAENGTQQHAIGFWYQNYSRALVGGYEHVSKLGSPHWRVRFTPETAGRWTWSIVVTTPSGTATSRLHTLIVRPSDRRGFMRRSTHDSRYLAYANGDPFFAVGENTSWYNGGGTYDYDRWFQQLDDQGANYARLWMPSWAFGIEWNDTPLGDYSQRLDRAWQLDYVFELARSHDIQVMLALFNHGAFSTIFNSEWDRNPYNAANGGPLTRPQDVFTDPTTESLMRQRIRYIVARWGASTALMSWEFWNEVDLVDGFDQPTVAAWHLRMNNYIRSIDPAKHLTTTSMAFPYANAELYTNAQLDIAQLHFYAGNGAFLLFPDLGRNVIDWTRQRIHDTGLPTLFGEIGVDSRGPVETRAADRDGKGLHDGLWAGIVSEGIGTAMPWWWDNLTDVEAARYYPMFGSVARFVNNVRWDRERFARAAAATTNTEFTIDGIQGDTIGLYWLRDTTDTWNARRPRIARNVAVQLPSLPSGAWCATWYDTWRGVAGRRVPVASHTLVAPDFRRDLALRLQRCGRTEPLPATIRIR